MPSVAKRGERSGPSSWARVEGLWAWAGGEERGQALRRRLGELDASYAKALAEYNRSRRQEGASAFECGALTLPLESFKTKLREHRSGTASSVWHPGTAQRIVGLVLGLAYPDDGSTAVERPPRAWFEEFLPQPARAWLARPLAERRRMADRWIAYLAEETDVLPEHWAPAAPPEVASAPPTRPAAPTGTPASASPAAPPEPPAQASETAPTPLALSHPVPEAAQSERPANGTGRHHRVAIGLVALAILALAGWQLARSPAPASPSSKRAVAAAQPAGEPTPQPADGPLGHGQASPEERAAGEAVGQADQAVATDPSQGPVQATLWASRGGGARWDLKTHPHVRHGDSVVLQVQAREPVHLVLFAVTAAGGLKQLYPSRGSIWVPAEATRTLPTEGPLRVDDNPGTEWLIALSLTAPLRGGAEAAVALLRPYFESDRWPAGWPRPDGTDQPTHSGEGTGHAVVYRGLEPPPPPRKAAFISAAFFRITHH